MKVLAHDPESIDEADWVIDTVATVGDDDLDAVVGNLRDERQTKPKCSVSGSAEAAHPAGICRSGSDGHFRTGCERRTCRTRTAKPTYRCRDYGRSRMGAGSDARRLHMTTSG